MKDIQNYFKSKIVKDIFDTIDIGVHILDSKGITVLYNKRCEEIEGITSNWIVGTDMNTLVGQGVYSESIALEVIEKGEKVAKTQKVNDRYIFSTGEPFYHNNHLVYVIISVMDMTNMEKLKFKYNELMSINTKIQRELNLLKTIEKDDIFISKSKSMEKVRSLALKVAKVDSNILIEGESGVGKGVLSKFIHDNSPRKDGSFVKIDCSSLPESLIESELFGYEEGAFTGARKEGKTGLIQLAHRGTLFLDEIGELPLGVQAKLLGVLQDKILQRIGGTKNISVDIRIIAATNRDLMEMVNEGTFRLDLYYRLKVVPIVIPPLRERKVDVVPLINLFLQRINSQYRLNKTISSKAMKLLMDYEWPGNVRELENEIERLVVTSDSQIIEPEDIDGLSINGQGVTMDDGILFKENIENYERFLLKEYMLATDNIHDLSEKTGLELSTIRKKAKKLGVDIKSKW